MLSCKQCGRIIANVSPRKNFTVCLKCRKEETKGRYVADSDIQEVAKTLGNAKWGKYGIWGKIHNRQELLDKVTTKKEALDSVKKLKTMEYFSKWKLWIEREMFT